MATTQRSTKEVVDDARLHLKELVDAHRDLAKAEVQEIVAGYVRAVVPLAVAGVLALYLLSFYAVTAAKGLSTVVEEWLAWLIVSGVLTLLVVVFGLVGKRLLTRAQAAGPETTKATVNETVGWAKGQLGKGDS